ncbi:hypothetical protein BG844_26335 [Couchioplanes caeruleus subsp. caeruleus]|uniref:Uncharacterized protein n=1 Tax=Couchioplanes caeruleus subsp. caeruleus TaxID=56427 RepID=A0A1K0FFC6_9ACTN|nr:hypothetical protein BG844_26335 [Couchioplanes caeruleus subsp. caeruleus]
MRPGAGLVAALAAGALLLAVPPAAQGRRTAPSPAALAWPGAERATIAATLGDGTAYEPGVFLDARTSVGTAPSPDGRSLRLLVRSGDGTVREMRALPSARNPSFQGLTVAGDLLAWFERTKDGLELWAAGLGADGAARRVTADTGDARFYRSETDLVVADGRLRWVAAGPAGVTEVRAVAAGGGPVEVRPVAGTWRLLAWPWMTDGVADSAGARTLRNLVSGTDLAVARPRDGAIGCSAAWCRIVSLDADGYTRIELMRPGGGDRHEVAGGTAATGIVDVAPLDRFEVFVRIGPNSELTGNAQLLVHETKTRSTVEISPDAGAVVLRNGVLCWSTGSQETFVRHTLDLRTVS